MSGNFNDDNFVPGQFDFSKLSEKYMNSLMRPVNDAVWDVTNGSLAIVGKNDSLYSLDTSSKEEGLYGILQNDFAFITMPIPAFAQSVPVETVKIEDFIYDGQKPMGWVVKISKSANNSLVFDVLRPSGTQSRWSPPKVQNAFTSGQNVQVLRTMTSMFGSNADNKMSEIQQMLPMMMMLGGNNGAGNIMQQMLPMMMMSGSTKMDPMMMFMLMQSGGFGGMNNQTVQNNQNTLANPARNNPFKRP